MSQRANSASRVIWDWRGEGAARRREARRQHTRRMGVIQAVVGGVIAVVLFLFGRQIFAAVVLGIATFSLLAALLSPLGLSLRLQRMLIRVGTAIGQLLTWILLIPLFLFFFVPFRFLFRRGRRDPLDRRLEPESVTYWKTREAGEPRAEAYERQF